MEGTDWIWMAVGVLALCAVVFAVMAFTFYQQLSNAEMNRRFEECDQNSYERYRKLEKEFNDQLTVIRSSLNSLWVSVDALESPKSNRR